MELSKNDNIELNIDALTSEGSGVGRYDGLAVFVNDTVPGDRIIAHIIKRSKNYAVGKVDKVISPSSSRIESDCPHSKKCGGCSFRNMTYDEELKYKLSRVNDSLKRIGHLDIQAEEIIGAESVDHYRNKACSDCRLQPEEFEQGIKAFEKWVEAAGITSYDENTSKGLLRHIYFRKGFATNELMACAVINGDSIPKADLLIELLLERLPNLKSVVLNINKNRTNVILGKNSKTIWGSDTISDVLLGKRFVISPNSFYQVNHCQCERLYEKARKYAGLTGNEVLLDLYCGVGTIGLTMADRVKQLVGIEIIPQAIENAKINAGLNGITNSKFICADAANGADLLKKEGIKPDIVILDPPRKGCDKALLDTVEQMSPKKIVYVSCDSATLARDLEILKNKNYITQSVTAVDMFPRTPHVEAVALIIKNKVNR